MYTVLNMGSGLPSVMAGSWNIYLITLRGRRRRERKSCFNSLW